jgi:hypothetical protein
MTSKNNTINFPTQSESARKIGKILWRLNDLYLLCLGNVQGISILHSIWDE